MIATPAGRRKERREWHQENHGRVLTMIANWKLHDPDREVREYLNWLRTGRR